MKPGRRRQAPRAARQTPDAGTPAERGEARIAAARKEIVQILDEAAPGRRLGEGPLERLAIYLSEMQMEDWRRLEIGSPEVLARLDTLEEKARDLLREIDRAQSGQDALRVPGGGAWLTIKMQAAVQPVRDLADQIRREKDSLPQGEGRQAWKGWAQVFYDLAVQAWLDGGEPFWRDQDATQRNFGIHPDGKATVAVQGILALAMKGHPSRKPPSAETISDFLATLPDPLPWSYEPVGEDFEAYLRGEWDYDGFRRINLRTSNPEQKDAENIVKKKRGRPRGK